MSFQMGNPMQIAHGHDLLTLGGFITRRAAALA
jgi:hypothetical protein